jgi:hypothetical protein
LSVVMVCAVWSLVEAGLGGRSYNINSQQPYFHKRLSCDEKTRRSLAQIGNLQDYCSPSNTLA